MIYGNVILSHICDGTVPSASSLLWLGLYSCNWGQRPH